MDVKDIKVGMELRQVKRIYKNEDPIVRVTKIEGDVIHHVHKGRTHEMTCDASNFQPIRGDKMRKSKPKPNTHIVVWDVEGCGDPYALYTCIKDAKKQVMALMDDNNVKKDSIRVFVIKKELKPKLSIRLGGV